MGVRVVVFQLFQLGMRSHSGYSCCGKNGCEFLKVGVEFGFLSQWG